MNLVVSEIVGGVTIYRNAVGRSFAKFHFNYPPLHGEDADCDTCGYTIRDHMELAGITNPYKQIVFVTTSDPQVVVCEQCVVIDTAHQSLVHRNEGGEKGEN